MPIKIPNQLPATQTLRQENIFVMTETRAIKQDIRPLRILLLNLMPTKVDTETQFARVLGNTPLQIELELVAPRSHVSKNTSQEHMLAFYKTFDEVKDQNFDGLIITGAPVEHLPFEEVDYWPELCRIMEWSKHTSTRRFTSAGARRRGFTIIMAFPSGRFRRSFSVCSATRWRSRTSCFSAALTMSSGCRIRETRRFCARTSKGAGAQDPLVLGNRRRIRRQNARRPAGLSDGACGV